MNPKHALKIINNNKGIALVEFALILPVIVIIMMCLLITYDLIHEMASVQENLRYEFRKSIDEHAADPFHRFETTGEAVVRVPGVMKTFLERRTIVHSLRIAGYEGSYHGLGYNQYRLGSLYRQINP